MKSIKINSETSIPAVGFGTYLISNSDVADAVSSAISAGYRHIDTAWAYGNEEGVGAGIRRGLDAEGLDRDEIFVTTKLQPGMPSRGMPAKTAKQTIEEFGISLKRLGLDYLDLYLIHAPFGGELRVEQWKALNELRSSGRVRSIGVSNFNPGHIEELRDAGLPLPDVNQIELHPWCQQLEYVSYMSGHNIVPIAYSSLAPLSTWRVNPGQDSGKTDEMRNTASAFEAIASKYGVSEAQLLLRWAVQKGYAVIPKTLSPQRMRQNIDIFSFEIGETDMRTMNDMDRNSPVAWAIGDPSK